MFNKINEKVEMLKLEHFFKFTIYFLQPKLIKLDNKNKVTNENNMCLCKLG